MSFNIDELKKKIIYRSSYRGSKELDTLLSSFSKSLINTLNEKDLIDLSNFLNNEDESLYKFYKGSINNSEIKDNRISRLFRTFKINKRV